MKKLYGVTTIHPFTDDSTEAYREKLYPMSSRLKSGAVEIQHQVCSDSKGCLSNHKAALTSYDKVQDVATTVGRH